MGTADAESLLNALFGESEEIVFAKDGQGRYCKVSPALARMWRRTPADLLGRTDFDLFPTALAAAWRGEEETIMENGRPIVSQALTWPLGEGRQARLALSKYPWRNPAGQTIGIWGLAREAAQLEDFASRYSTAGLLLNAVLENSDDNIFFKNRQHRFIRAGRSSIRRLNLRDESEILGKTDADFFTAGEARDAHLREQEIMETGQPKTDHLSHKRWSNGECPWILGSRFALRDSDGRVVGTFGIGKNVTTLIETEQQLARANELLRALLEASPDKIYFKDCQSRIIRCSRSMALMVGKKDPAELIGLSDADLFTPEHAEPARRDEEAIMSSGQPIINKLEKETFPDGRATWCLSSKLPMTGVDGQITGTFGISRDITELKMAQDELQKTSTQLIEASRLAGRAEVATGVLHNIGNVLTSVNVSATVVTEGIGSSRLTNLGRLGLLLRDHRQDLARYLTEDSKGRLIPDYLVEATAHLGEEMSQWLAELSRLRKYIDHIRDIVNLQQDYARTSQVKRQFDLAALLEDALKINAAGLDRHNIEVRRDYAPIPPLYFESPKILQILVNLISNAKYALDDNTGHRLLDLRIALDGPESVKIAVTDNGMGIAPENLPRIFEHGFTTRPSGHGFGLHSAALAAIEMGGSLCADSPGLGKGATFVLRLPLITETHSP